MIFRLVLQKLIHNKTKTLVICGTFFIVFLFTFILIFFYKNIENYFIDREIGQFDTKNFEVVYEKSKIGGLFKSLGTKEDFENKVKKLENDPNIDYAYKFYRCDVPISISINLLGTKIDTDVFLFAVSDNFFAGENLSGNYIPVGISDDIIQFYNLQLANGEFFPKVPKKMFYHLDFDLFFNKSMFFDMQEPVLAKKAQIRKIEKKLPLVGITIPYSNLQKSLNEIKKGKISTYRILGKVKDDKYIDKLEEIFKDYYVITDDKTLQNIKDRLYSVKIIFLVLNICMISVLIGFLIHLIYTLLDANKKNFEIFRIHGANKLNIFKIILYEIYLYLFLGYSIFLLFYFGLKYRGLSLLNNFLNEKYLINYNFDILSIDLVLYIFVGYFFVFVVLSFLFSFWEINKKFEN